jgi:hypothetical protein
VLDESFVVATGVEHGVCQNKEAGAVQRPLGHPPLFAASSRVCFPSFVAEP